MFTKISKFPKPAIDKLFGGFIVKGQRDYTWEVFMLETIIRIVQEAGEIMLAAHAEQQDISSKEGKANLSPNTT